MAESPHGSRRNRRSWLQIALGIATLLLAVPLGLAAAHQAGAVLVFAAALRVAHALRSAPDAHQGDGGCPLQRSPDGRYRSPVGCAGITTMTVALTLDVRGMEPPEPLERILQEIDKFGTGDRLRVIIDCRPHPLFRILERDGFAYREEAGTTSLYEITIWRKG